MAALARAMSDETVIRGFLDGDLPCTRRVSTWIDEVLRHPRLGLGHDAEDVGQQVRRNLVVAFRDGRFAGHASLRTYVWRIAQHAAIDHLRARRAKPSVSLDDIREPTDAGASPEHAALKRERREMFARILAALSDECRHLFHLIVFEELSYAEIARRLQATEGAIKVRALRCREKAAAEYVSVTSGAGLRPLREEDV